MADHIQIRAGGVRLLTIKGTLTVKDMRAHYGQLLTTKFGEMRLLN